MKELTVKKNDANQRLDRFVAKAVPLLPESLLQKYIRLKRIKLNGKGVKRDTRVSEGDVLSLYINDEFFEKPHEDNSYLRVGSPKVDIVYEDENILLADKKPGVLCHSAGQWDYNTLIAHIQAYAYQKGEWRPREEISFAPALCNRIDRNTGGIVIAAKTTEALRILNQKIRDRELDKRYLAVVEGTPRPETGVLKGYLFKDAVKNRVFVTDTPQKGAKTCETRYRTLTKRGGLSLVECELITGRTHQIRAHLAYLGKPVLGDIKYGNRKMNERTGAKTQALCAVRISFLDIPEENTLHYLSGKVIKLKDPQIVKQFDALDKTKPEAPSTERSH